MNDKNESWLSCVRIIQDDSKTAAENERTCGDLFYIGLGEERACGKPAVAILDEGRACAFFVCEQCAGLCHLSRLTMIENETTL